MKRDHALLRWGFVSLILLMTVAGSGCSNVVRLPDCGDCRPVEMSMSQVFEIELGPYIDSGLAPDETEWIVADPGEMTLVEQEEGTRPNDPNETPGGFASLPYVLMRFEPTAAGTTQMIFHCVRVDDPNASPIQSMRVTIEVSA